MVMKTDDNDVHPWRIYGKEYKVPESKMGKAAEEDKEKPMSKSTGELLDEMIKSVTPVPPTDAGIDLLKSCKSSMEKSEDEKKAYMGSLDENVRFKPGTGGVSAPGTRPADMKRDSNAPPPVPLDASGGGEKKKMNKALTSMAVPRLPRAMQHEMIRRNAQSVMTRGNSRFAKDIHTGPLTGEVVEEVSGGNRAYGKVDTYKSCENCGRRYRLFKGTDSECPTCAINSECPTCAINKSTHCSKCGSQLVKSHGGGIARCPLCG
jgi:hypothetical protein